jgi:L-fuconolactonase
MECSTTMRIDAHQHFWVYDSLEYDWIGDSMASQRRDFLPVELKYELEGAGFQGCVARRGRRLRRRDGFSS